MKILLVVTSIICLGGAALGLLFQFQWETKILKRNAELQVNLTEAGIRQVWIDTLAEAADRGVISEGFNIEMDRAAQKILTPFFPEQKVKLDWAKFRTAKGSDRPAAQAFLSKALAMPRSWDKILAIQAYHDLTGNFPDTLYSGYEETIVFKEAHQAYRKIFSVLSKGMDFADAGSKSQFYGCFVKVTSAGTIKAYIPKRDDILKTILPQFEAKIFRKESSIGDTSLELAPGIVTSDLKEIGNTQSGVLFVISLIALVVGIGTAWRMILVEQKQVLHRVTFLNQVVHELNTPLAAIKLHAQLMSQEFKQNESVLYINNSIARMIKLFGEVTEINRQGSKPVFNEISPDKFMQMIQNLKVEAPDKITIEGKVLNAISSDSSRLNIVLRNLVQNGVRYGNEVIIKIDDGSHECQISVCDDGPGVPWSERRKIFLPFYRAKDAKRKVPDGIGLGLSIAKKIAREMGATLVLKNPGKPGAIFLLTLKRKDLNEKSTHS